MLRKVLGVSAVFALQSLTGWGQQLSLADTIASDPFFGGYEFRVRMPLGQTFVNSAMCSDHSTVRFHLPDDKAHPIVFRDTLGRLLSTTVSLASPKTRTYSASMSRGAGQTMVTYEVSGSLTMDDDPARYLMELRPDSRVPISLDMELGYGSAWLDLTDLDVRGLRIRTGNANVFISYKQHNAQPMRILTVDGGMSKIVVRNLEYARAEKVRIENGMGDTRIIVGKEVRTRSTVNIHVGAGTCRMLAHRDAPIRLVVNDNVFSAVEVPEGFMKSGDNVYENLAFKRAGRNGMTVIVDLGIGTFRLIPYNSGQEPGGQFRDAEAGEQE